MFGLSGAIELAKRAMMAHQAAIDVYGHNIANVNTPGYTRQRAVLGASLPLNVAPGALGTGVDIVEIRRNREYFTDQQLRREKGLLGQLETRSGVLGQVEALFNEPSQTGVSSLLDKFFGSLSDLSNNPGDRGAKVSVQAAGRALASGIRRLDTRLAEYRLQLNDEVNLKTEEANRLTRQVADLNVQIVAATNVGLNPNDLLDQRDQIVDQLAELIGTTAIPQKDGSISLRLGGKAIVDNARAETLSVQARGLSDPAGAPLLYEDGTKADIQTGRLGALLTLRDSTLQELRDGLDTLAQGLVTEMNALHRQGQNGVDFFTGTDAASIDLSAAVETDPGAINASRTSYPGANELALEMAALKNTATLSHGNATFSTYFGGLVAGLGAETRAAADGSRNQALAVQQVDNQRAAVSGVNLDEELANLAISQKAYQAAARYMSTISDMLENMITDLTR